MRISPMHGDVDVHFKAVFFFSNPAIARSRQGGMISYLEEVREEMREEKRR